MAPAPLVDRKLVLAFHVAPKQPETGACTQEGALLSGENCQELRMKRIVPYECNLMGFSARVPFLGNLQLGFGFRGTSQIYQ